VSFVWPAVLSQKEDSVQLNVELFVKPTTNTIIIIIIIIIIIMVVVRRLQNSIWLPQNPVGTQKNFS